MADNKVEIQVQVGVDGAPRVDALAGSLNSTAASATALGDKSAKSSAGIDQANAAAASYTATSRSLRDGMESVSVQMASARSELLSLVGVGAGTQGLKNIADLADSYNNLQARIKLATGEGTAFDTAFAGVFDVALRTNSAVEETGLLFTKLAEAGKALGVSQGEALKLTETINQAIQLSGGSAEAAKASITQLVQGLQGGVLRGDEFNSVMEQSPRLAKALADGLSVGTGELRKMAEEGKLTSDVIIKALQGQSDAVASEFGKLPATVGRAMTNLTTEFTRYVGEADKAGGYTSKLAGLIDALAGNLSTVATVMIHTGEVMGAMKLLSMAQNWAAASAAVTANASATTAATVQTAANTAAKELNTKATLTNAAAAAASATAYDSFGMAIAKQTPALTGNALAMTELGKGLGGAATGAAGVAVKFEQAAAPVGVLAKTAGLAGSALSMLAKAAAPLLALDIAFHFKEYGTAIGEWAARMMGAKDRSAELASAEKAANQIAADNIDMRKRQAAALVEATNASWGLSKAATGSIAEFDKLTKAGDTASEAIKKIGKDFDLGQVPGIKDAASVLAKLAADSKITAAEFQAAWADALKDQDLAKFEVKFRAAMLQVQSDAEKASDAVAGAIARGVEGKELEVLKEKYRTAMAAAGHSADQLAQVLDASLREAIRRTGLDFDLISGGMSKASISAINDTDAMIKGLDRLKAMGVDTAQALTASLGKGIDTADSQKALEAVRLQIESVRKVLGDKITDGLLDQAKTKATELGDALDKATPGITSLREAMKELGVTSDQTFADTAAKSATAYQAMKDSGTASVRELQDGFKKYAADAIAAAGEVGSTQRAVTEETLKTEAALRGLTVAFDENGKMAIDSQAKAASAFDGTRNAIDEATSALQRQNIELEKTIAAEEKANELKDRAAALELKKNNPNPIPTLDWVPNFQTEAEGKVWLETTKARMMQENVSGGAVLGNAGVWIDQTLMAEYNKQMQLVKDAEKTEFANQAASAGYSSSQSLGLADEYLNRRKSGSASGSFSDFLSQTRAGDKAAPAPTPAQTTPSPDAKTPTSASTQNHTYTVNIPNYGTVNVASASDASSLTNIIDQLARAKAAAGV